MEEERRLLKDMAKVMYKITIPFKLPSLNEYIRVCRTNPYKASKFKDNIESNISIFFDLPQITRPVVLHFRWVEDNKRRDLDNVAAGKKFILDALVKSGIIPNDNHNYVKGFTDTFDYAKEALVEIEIEEVS